jgi:preprotein translocase subunit YajC
MSPTTLLPLLPATALTAAPSTAATLATPPATVLVQGDTRPGGAPVETEAPPPGGLFGGGFGLLPMVVVFAIFWFVMIGPERKNRKKREEMLAAVKKGDEVMLSSGLYARVVSLQDEVAVLQIADGVRAKYSRGAIQSVVEATPAETPAKED